FQAEVGIRVFHLTGVQTCALPIYLGRGDVTLTHLRGRNEFSLMARHSLRSGDRSRGALQFDWGFPLHESLPMRGRLQLFHGYGESLIDYNHKATYVGLGISLQEWFNPGN